MRKVIKKGLLSVALLATVVTNASEKLSVKVASENSRMLSISLTEVTSNEVVYIKDFKGEVLFSETLEKSAEYAKVFNFSPLPEGLYFIESKEKEKVQVTPVIINADGVTLVDNSVKTYLAPEITLNDDVMKVLIRNYNNTDVSIAIYDEKGTLLTKTKENKNTLVFGHYDIKRLVSQKVTISVTEGEYNFIKEIEL